MTLHPSLPKQSTRLKGLNYVKPYETPGKITPPANFCLSNHWQHPTPTTGLSVGNSLLSPRNTIDGSQWGACHSFLWNKKSSLLTHYPALFLQVNWLVEIHFTIFTCSIFSWICHPTSSYVISYLMYNIMFMPYNERGVLILNLPVALFHGSAIPHHHTLYHIWCTISYTCRTMKGGS